MRYQVETELKPEQVIDEALQYFGKEGLGLEKASQEAQNVTFEGGGGYVSVAAHQPGEQDRTEVELLTQEWDNPVRQFMGKIKG